MRVSLSYGGRKILLHEGTTIIGRGLECGIRFNDPTVSRHHAQITVTQRGRPTLENLSKTNSTTVNGARLGGVRELIDGDQIGLGHRILKVELIEEVARQHPRPITLDAGSGGTESDDEIADELTQPGTIDPSELEAGVVIASVTATPRFDLFESRDCPRCRKAVPYTEDTCSGCGYSWPPGRPGAVTQQIRLSRKGRSSPRYPVELPIIYSSDGMTFEAMVRDISRGGLFVATELLEPVGTECALTALPDGHPAVTFHGTVAHVAAHPTETGRPAGLGIQFTEIPPAGARWLASLLGQQPPPEA